MVPVRAARALFPRCAPVAAQRAGLRQLPLVQPVLTRPTFTNFSLSRKFHVSATAFTSNKSMDQFVEDGMENANQKFMEQYVKPEILNAIRTYKKKTKRERRISCDHDRLSICSHSYTWGSRCHDIVGC
jgi:hypothetical protein